MDIEGIEALSPKKALQFAYQLAWIEDVQAWLQMLNDRNITSHYLTLPIEKSMPWKFIPIFLLI